MPAEIKSPAITARGERGRDGLGEGTTAGGCVIAGEEPCVILLHSLVSTSSQGVNLRFGELVEVSVNVTVNGTVPVYGVAVKFATGDVGLERRICAITFFRIVVILSLLANPAETIVLADVMLPPFLLKKPHSGYRRHLPAILPIGWCR